MNYEKNIPFTFQYPEKSEVFNALRTQYIKVIILGMCPNAKCKGFAYYNKSSVNNPMVDVIEEVEHLISQGVMLLNWNLTYPKNEYWDSFMIKLIPQIEMMYPKAVVLLPTDETRAYEKYFTNTVVYEIDDVNPLLKDRFTFETNKYATLASHLDPSIIWNKRDFDERMKETFYLISFVDGSFRKNTGKAAWGLVLPHQLYGLQNSIIGNSKGLLPPKSTIIDAEGTALYKTFNIFSYAAKYFPYKFRAIVVTDNEFWYKTILGIYHTTEKAELYNKIMKQVIFDLDLFWIPSHNKTIKNKEAYRTFNKRVLSDHEVDEFIVELKAGNDSVDSIVINMTK